MLGSKRFAKADAFVEFAAMLFPVGLPLGAMWGSHAEPSQSAGIRLGTTIQAVDHVAYWLWTMCFGTPSREDAEAMLNSAGLDAGILGSLMATGLVLDTDAVDWEVMLKAHRLAPIGIGLGNRFDSPTIFFIGHAESGAAVAISATTYAVWASASGQSMWSECESVALDSGSHVGQVAALLVAELSTLLRHGVAIIDLAAG